MTLRFLLDTNIVSDPIAKKPNRKVIARLTQHSLSCAIAAPVWHELIYGCQLLADGKRRTAADEYLQNVVKAAFPILPYDEPAALWHGLQRARLEKAGRTVPFVDGQIAAIANRHDLTLVTSNPKHFALFQELTIVDWSA